MVFAVGAAVSAAASCLGQATFKGIGDLPGGDVYSAATAVSRNGLFVVGCSHSAVGQEAFLWWPSNGMVPLGDLPGGGVASCAYGVADDGRTIVGEATNQSGTAAFRWTLSLGMRQIVSLPTGKPPRAAFGVSTDGTVVVGETGLGGQAFRWTAGTGVVMLGDLPGGESSSTARGLSSDGRVVVGSGNSPLGVEAVRWALQGPGPGVMQSLGELPGGKYGAAGWAVSPEGGVVVGGSISILDDTEAFRWTQATGMVGLGDLPGGLFDSFAYGASDDGQVIVGRAWGPAGLTAFVWTPAAGMRSLIDVLKSQGLTLTGWALNTASAVSADGQVIVGMGTHLGESEGWVAGIPRYCPPDCNVDGHLTAGDLVCFQSRFIQGDLLYADCNADGHLSVQDWICFQALFIGGCPAAESHPDL